MFETVQSLASASCAAIAICMEPSTPAPRIRKGTNCRLRSTPPASSLMGQWQTSQGLKRKKDSWVSVTSSRRNYLMLKPSVRMTVLRPSHRTLESCNQQIWCHWGPLSNTCVTRAHTISLAIQVPSGGYPSSSANLSEAACRALGSIGDLEWHKPKLSARRQRHSWHPIETGFR